MKSGHVDVTILMLSVCKQYDVVYNRNLQVLFILHITTSRSHHEPTPDPVLMPQFMHKSYTSFHGVFSSPHIPMSWFIPKLVAAKPRLVMPKRPA